MGNGDVGISAIGLRYFAPAPDLRRHLSAYYIFRADLPQVSDVIRADMAQLRFMVSGLGSYGFADGRCIAAPEITLLGPTTAATRFDVAGPVLVFGVGILPAGWAALVEEDASLFADSLVDAVDVFGGMLEDTLDAMRFDNRGSRMIAMVDAVMRGLLADAVDAPYWFTTMADRWLTTDASPSVDVLVREAGVSARQVERLARRIYGAPPKLLARKYRALRCSARIALDHESWQALCDDGSFYDQSHFIREFKHFVGITPNQLRTNASLVLRLTMARREIDGSIAELSRLS